MGLEHLREVLVRLARPLLRQGASVAYGGHWKDTDDNFTFDLLRLIAAEQEDNSLGGPDTNLTIGRLYNHSAWPTYLDITARIEAQWINCCRIVRITQKKAGIADADTVPDGEANSGSDSSLRNAAICLSVMRKLSMEGLKIDIPDVPSPEYVPPIAARVILGGKMEGFVGFLPGIFEESLETLEHRVPLYILGGFGGAAEALATALSATTGRASEFTAEWHNTHTPALMKLERALLGFALPPTVHATAQALDRLFEFVQRARVGLSSALNTGLDEAETRELLKTRDINRAVNLVRKGLEAKIGLTALPS